MPWQQVGQLFKEGPIIGPAHSFSLSADRCGLRLNACDDRARPRQRDTGGGLGLRLLNGWLWVVNSWLRVVNNWPWVVNRSHAPLAIHELLGKKRLGVPKLGLK